jgi:hypothetical protein
MMMINTSDGKYDDGDDDSHLKMVQMTCIMINLYIRYYKYHLYGHYKYNKKMYDIYASLLSVIIQKYDYCHLYILNINYS